MNLSSKSRRSTLRKTVVLTSRENFVWQSMQEIVPSWEKSWSETAIEGLHEVVILNVDEIKLKDVLIQVIDAQNIAAICFTVPICRILSFIRNELNLTARFFIFLYSQATIACWPFRAWGLESFRADDVFIASSNADARSMSLTFSSCRVEVVPFHLSDDFLTGVFRESVEDEAVKFVYVGRVSAQKNLHSLLLGLALLKEKRTDLTWCLDIYGGEDDLGSPNMGMENRQYLSQLKALVDKLGLFRNIKFHGFLPRETIDQKLKLEKYIFISMSLHSDENFGMAAYRSLCQGQICVLSDWGGHQDFKIHFPNQVFLTQVSGGWCGPWTSPTAITESLIMALDAKNQHFDPVIPDYYKQTLVAKRLYLLAMENSDVKDQINFTELANELFLKRQRNMSIDNIQTKIFDSYQDSNAHLFFMNYGMRGLVPEVSKKTSLRAIPWSFLRNNTLIVEDPHRGTHSIDLEIRFSKGNDSIQFEIDRQSVCISRVSALRLLQAGYGILEDRPSASFAGIDNDNR